MAFGCGNVVLSHYVDILWSLLKRPGRFVNATETNVTKPSVSPSAVDKHPSSIPNHTPPLFALIIGINKYKSFAVTTLKGAVPDANSVQQYLEKELNVPSSHIRNLRNEEATRAAIVDAFRQLQDDSRIKNGDPILIFYAGHGGEVDAPVGWEAGDTKTQMLVPHDFRTKVNNRDVHGIPDRTIAALLDRLSEKKGDNITVIFDCCHSGSGTRVDQTDPTRLSRVTEIPNNVPATLDRDIWHGVGSNRGMKTAPGFLQCGLKSHVLLAACGAKEQAKEEQGQGVFTKAFLEVLTTVGADKLTYCDLLHRIYALPEQNPQCEGYHRNRIFFNSKAPSPGRTFYSVYVEDGKYIMQAGAAHGITDGAEFDVYQDQELPPKIPLLGTLLVLEIESFRTTLDVPLGATRFALSQPAFALQTKKGTEEDLRLHVAGDEKLTSVFNAIVWEMQRTGSEQRGILLVDKDKAELDITLKDDRVVFNLMNTHVIEFGLTRMPFSVSPDVDEVYPIIRASAHYYWHLRHTNKKEALQNKVRIEFIQLKQLKDEYDDDFNPVIVPVGENLNCHGTVDLVVDNEIMYGIKIVNDTKLALYPSLFFFDNSDLSITPYYQSPNAGKFKVDPPISPFGSLTIGYGSGGSSPFNYFLRDGQDIDVGFLKLFLTTEQADFSNVPQPSPFNIDTGNRTLQQVKPKPPPVWDSIHVTVVQRRGPVTKSV